MIKFKNLNPEKPFQILKEEHDKALAAGQKNIDAISIASYNKINGEVDSRCVNLKYVDDHSFIFFSNYNSPKAIAFKSHDQISALLFWSSTNTQIRIKAKIKKTSASYNKKYFKSRSLDKNALAISSDQSQQIKDFNQVIEKYQIVKETARLNDCPNYWGGYSFSPYEIEFWKGNDFRLNKRDLYKKDKNIWKHFILEP